MSTARRANSAVGMVTVCHLALLGRAAVMGTDALVAVVEPGKRSLETAEAVARMGREIGVRRFAAVLNKVTDPAQVETVRAGLPEGMVLLGHVAYSPDLQQFLTYYRIFGKLFQLVLKSFFVQFHILQQYQIL